jgi:serine/threonine protein kinase
VKGQSVSLELDGYSNITEIGSGGFADVYSAIDQAHNRPVAIKVLHERDVSPYGFGAFDRERTALGRLSDHPSIVSLHGSGVSGDGRPYLIMDLLSGGSLAEHIAATGPLEWDEATAIAIRLAGALDTAHQLGIRHRDVKPANVLRSAHGDWHLTDFGVSSLVGTAATGEVVTSLPHAAPELFAGAEFDELSDLYSLASTLYTSLTGLESFRPHDGDSDEVAIERIVAKPPPDARPHGVPDSLARFLESAMSKDPSVRPQSASAFADQLTRVRSGLDTAPPSRTSTDATPSVAWVPPTESSPEADDTRRKRLLMPVAGALAAIAVTTIGLTQLVDDSSTQSPIVDDQDFSVVIESSTEPPPEVTEPAPTSEVLVVTQVSPASPVSDPRPPPPAPPPVDEQRRGGDRPPDRRGR